MNAFEEFMFDESYVLRFYRVDHGLVCTINESMVSELRELEAKLRQQQAEIDLLRMTQPNIDYEKELLKPTFVGRELTDKEILEEWDWDSGEILAIDLIDFGHSILRKAQEK